MSRELLNELYWDYSLSQTEIAKRLCVKQPTIFYWMNKYKLKTRDKNKAISMSRVKLNLNPSTPLSYILGVLLGDGSAFKYKHGNGSSYMVQLQVVDPSFAKNFTEELKLIGMNPKTQKIKNQRYTNGHIYQVQAYSKVFVDWFSKLSIQDIKSLISKEKNFVINFLKGFFDSEGHFGIYKNAFYKNGKKYTYIQWYCNMTNTDIQLLKMIKDLIETIGLNSKVYGPYENNGFSLIAKPIYRLTILGGKNKISSFLKAIKPSIPRKTISSEAFDGYFIDVETYEKITRK